MSFVFIFRETGTGWAIVTWVIMKVIMPATVVKEVHKLLFWQSTMIVIDGQKEKTSCLVLGPLS